MNGKDELKERMKSKGFGVISFSKAIGMSHQSFYSKIKGITSFNVDEVLAIKEALGLSNEDVLRIFFSELSENNE